MFDTLIIGGGPAGLSVATGLARQLHRAVVFDSGVYRNALTTHMHNIATWDHQPPEVFRSTGRQRLSRYDTIQVANVEIARVEKTIAGHFNAYDTNDKLWEGKKLVLATGVRDIFPNIEGYAECWATGIFHCLFCHGFEERGCDSAGILAIGDMAVTGLAIRVARMAKRFTSQVTIYTHGTSEFTNELETALEGSDIRLDTRSITKLSKGSEKSEVKILFEDGSAKMEGFLSHKPKTEINGPFAGQLGVELTSAGDIKTEEPFHNTSIKGVYAAGDCAIPLKTVVTSMSSGTLAAAGLVGELQAE